MNSEEDKTTELARAIGLPSAVMLGLGSILGTGVFVSLGIGAGIAGTNGIACVVSGGPGGGL